MLVNAKEMLNKALEEHYAIPHFNINNLEWTKYILEACQNLNIPVILGVSEGAKRYMGGYNVITGMVKGFIKDLKITIPVAIHLDHASSAESCIEAIDAGFTSVMIDASRFPLSKNIRITKEVVNYARKHNVSVEAEVGHIGGMEDNVVGDVGYSTLEECKELVENTGIDFLAPALGSVHGFYKGEPKLDFHRMKEISETLHIPLVLHGGTGIPDAMLQEAIRCGVAKININTELQSVWSIAVKEYLQKNPNVYDPRKIISAGEKALKAKVEEKVSVLMSQKS